MKIAVIGGGINGMALLRFKDFELFYDDPFILGISGEQEIIYFDEHHLNQVGANYYAKEAIQIIQEELQ